jgi:hypothetical protein
VNSKHRQVVDIVLQAAIVQHNQHEQGQPGVVGAPMPQHARTISEGLELQAAEEEVLKGSEVKQRNEEPC